jgi:hypothetical protein
MGIANDGEQGKTKVEQRGKNSKLENNAGGVGTFQGSSATDGLLSRGNARKDSPKSASFANERRYSIEDIDGGIVSQLRKDTEEQLAFYESQVKKLKIRLQELDSLSENHIE